MADLAILIERMQARLDSMHELMQSAAVSRIEELREIRRTLERAAGQREKQGQDIAVLKEHVMGNGGRGLVRRMSAQEENTIGQKASGRVLAAIAGVILGAVVKLLLTG